MLRHYSDEQRRAIFANLANRLGFKRDHQLSGQEKGAFAVGGAAALIGSPALIRRGLLRLVTRRLAEAGVEVPIYSKKALVGGVHAFENMTRNEQYRAWLLRNQGPFADALKGFAKKVAESAEELKAAGDKQAAHLLRRKSQGIRLASMLADNPLRLAPIRTQAKEELKNYVTRKLVRQGITPPVAVGGKIATFIRHGVAGFRIKPINPEATLERMADQVSAYTISKSARRIFRTRATVAKRLKVLTFGGTIGKREFGGIIPPIERRIKNITFDKSIRSFLRKTVAKSRSQRLRAGNLHKILRENPHIVVD